MIIKSNVQWNFVNVTHGTKDINCNNQHFHLAECSGALCKTCFSWSTNIHAWWILHLKFNIVFLGILEVYFFQKLKNCFILHLIYIASTYQPLLVLAIKYSYENIFVLYKWSRNHESDNRKCQTTLNKIWKFYWRLIYVLNHRLLTEINV